MIALSRNIGLVFSGGGGKGAYEIGVWNYLREAKLDKKVKIISGTSVGALNAALFAGSTYRKAKTLWHNISKEKKLDPRMSWDVKEWIEKPRDDIEKWARIIAESSNTTAKAS